MRSLIATAQLIVLTVIAISIMREVKHAEAGRAQRLQLLQSLAAHPDPDQPTSPECVIELHQPIAEKPCGPPDWPQPCRFPTT